MYSLSPRFLAVTHAHTNAIYPVAECGEYKKFQVTKLKSNYFCEDSESCYFTAFDRMPSVDFLEEKSHNFKATQNADYQIVVDSFDDSSLEFEVEHTNCCTQTYNDYFISTSEKEIYSSRCEIKKLKSDNSKLHKELKSANAVISSMKNIFTDGQIRKMANPEKNVKLLWEDISVCMCLHASGPKAYNHLYEKGFPLPHVSSLQRWARKIEVNEGVINVSLAFM